MSVRRAAWSGAAAGAIALMGVAAATAATAATAPSSMIAGADRTHPWHDAFAEVRVVAGESRLEVSMRVDGAHLEAMVSERSGAAVDLDRATGGSADELRLAAYVRDSMAARFEPVEGADTGVPPPNDHFDFHWFGRELEGTDCWLYFEWIAPPTARMNPAAGTEETDGTDGTDGADARRVVQVRSTLLIEPHMQQVNTVSVPGHAAVSFAAGATDWRSIDVALPPRSPRPLRVARSGSDGPRVLVLAGPAGPGDLERRLARRLGDGARVELAFWPGMDGGAPPPTSGPGARPWLDWSARSLGRTLDAAEAEADPVLVLLTHPAAAALLAASDAAPERPGLRAVVHVAAPVEDDVATGGDSDGDDNGFSASIIRRHRTEADSALASGGDAALVVGEGLVPRDVAIVVSTVLERLTRR